MRTQARRSANTPLGWAQVVTHRLDWQSGCVSKKKKKWSQLAERRPVSLSTEDFKNQIGADRICSAAGEAFLFQQDLQFIVERNKQ